MKLSFSNRGWRDFSFEGMLDTASDMGFSGVEVYNLHTLPSMTEKGAPFHKYNVASTARQMRERNLAIPCFDTSCDISGDATVIHTVIGLMEIARDANVPYVVVCALHTVCKYADYA